MNKTQYKGNKLTLILIPNSINLSEDLLDKSPDIDFSNYSKLSTILYPDALYFYHKVNQYAINNSSYDLSDIFVEVSTMTNNTDYIDSVSNEKAEKAGDDLLDDLVGKLCDKYSMLELSLILSKNFAVSVSSGKLFVKASQFETDKATLKKLNREDKWANISEQTYENYLKLIDALSKQIRMDDLERSGIFKYFIDFNLKRQ